MTANALINVLRVYYDTQIIRYLMNQVKDH
jgi:hypothetical protein